jgi:hypothetical protein
MIKLPFEEIVAQLPEHTRRGVGRSTNIDYLETMHEHILAEGFIKWPDNPECWAGAYETPEGGYVWCSVSNSERCYGLKSMAETIAGNEKYATYSAYNLPPYLLSMSERKVKVHGSECTATQLTRSELDAIVAVMGKLDREQWEGKVEKLKSSMNSESRGYPTVEYPVKIYLAGTDDCSYSLCTATQEIANDIVSDLVKNPTWDKVRDYGFVFTN